jgi:SET domain-containing protein
MYRISVSQEMGRGLYATRTIEKGEVVAIEEVLLLSPKDTRLLEQTDLRHYTFRVSDLQDCLVLGDGELYNHSDTPNVNFELIYQDGRLKMLFTALKVVKYGEQLFINYESDADVDATEYFKTSSLMG